MKTFVPSKRKKQNIETHDFCTPKEWNVEMVSDKLIVTLSGYKYEIKPTLEENKGLLRDSQVCVLG